jgi:hypothetical protein
MLAARDGGSGGRMSHGGRQTLTAKARVTVEDPVVPGWASIPTRLAERKRGMLQTLLHNILNRRRGEAVPVQGAMH